MDITAASGWLERFAEESTAFLAIVTDDVVVCGRWRIGKRSPDVPHEFIVIHNAQSPNENKMSDGGRGRTSVEVEVWESSQM